MAFERLVGLDVTDDDGYQKYRAAMSPLLAQHGGGFRYDFRIAEVLRSETNARMNRVFTIRFPDRDASEGFFSNPEYKKIRAEFFESSVGATTLIAEYEPQIGPKG